MNEKYLEKSETDKRYQMENLTKSNIRYNQEVREDNYIIDTYTDMEHGPVHDTEEVGEKNYKNITTVTAANKQYEEVPDGKIDSDAAYESTTLQNIADTRKARQKGSTLSTPPSRQ